MSVRDGFVQEYAAALSSYVRGGGESDLVRAYELGRKALTDQTGLLELVNTHHDVLGALSAGEMSSARAAEFLTEALSPFEMALRGYEETNARLSAQNLELAAAKTATEVANRELEAFSYSVAHDLRAPLRAIDGFSRALLDEAGSTIDEHGKKHLDRVLDAAGRMARLIDDLLALSRVTRASLQREAVDVTALARLVVQGLQEADVGRSLDVVVEEGLVADADPRLLRVVFENLLGNAWKFTGKTQNARIEVGRTTSDQGEAFFVRDNGAGFDMAHAKRLFGAFQRLHTMKEFEGTGIGLATAQRIVHRHGGRIWGHGEPEKGATFLFTLA